MDAESRRDFEGSRNAVERDRIRNAASLVVQSSSDGGHGKRKVIADDQNECEVSDGADRLSTDRPCSQSSSKRSKVSFGLMSKSAPPNRPAGSSSVDAVTGQDKAPKPTSTPISMKLGTQKANEPAASLLPKTSVFGEAADDDDEEEMPPEAKMRMRNVGRETPTSTGPNSFGKTSKGFCDTRMIYEKELKKTSRGHDPGGNM